MPLLLLVAPTDLGCEHMKEFHPISLRLVVPEEQVMDDPPDRIDSIIIGGSLRFAVDFTRLYR